MESVTIGTWKCDDLDNTGGTFMERSDNYNFEPGAYESSNFWHIYIIECKSSIQFNFILQLTDWITSSV